MKLKEILDKQLSTINYSNEEISNFKKIADGLIKELKKQKLEAHVGGSLAKRTIIKSQKIPDIDIFVVFKDEKEIKNLGKILKKIKTDGKIKEIHGSRDYFQIIKKEVILELIPIIKTKNPALAKNVTDVSLSHVKYVSKKLKENPDLDNEIKLTKSFVKAQNCYGAEGYIQGFSGYSLELLVIHFGSFLKFLKNLNKKTIIPILKIIDRHKINSCNNCKKLTNVLTKNGNMVNADLADSLEAAHERSKSKFLQNKLNGGVVPKWQVTEG
jgi:tRNA nucleotidyltransferase (CCA-adding enzyme)